jgi:hypothetical protein
MSRHVFDREGIRVVVGWDSPMKTFFVQKGFLDPLTKEWVDDTEPFIWLGAKHEEIPTIKDLSDVCSKYQIGLSSEIFNTLEIDQENDV